MPSGTQQLSSGMSVSLRRPNGSIETNDGEKAQILANIFQIVLTRQSFLPEVVLQINAENAKMENVQLDCNNVNKIFKSLQKYKFPGPNGSPFKGTGGRK